MNPMSRPPRSRPYRALRRLYPMALAAVVLCASACSSGSDRSAPAVIEPASEAQSPPVTTAAAGSVIGVHGRVGALRFDTATRTLVAASADQGVLTFVDVPAEGSSVPQPQAVPLTGPVTALTGDDHGTIYAATRGGYLRVAMVTRRAEKVEIAGHEETDFTAIALRADGKLALGGAGEDGGATVYFVNADSDTPAPVEATVGGFAGVDALAVQGDTTAVLDRAQTSVTTVIGVSGSGTHALRAGEGATTMIADDKGRLLVADTRGGGLLVFSAEPLILRQRYPVPDAPYGLTSSPHLVWVSQTATNQVIGYDLSTGIPEERTRFPTVRQPNSLASDGDTLFVASGVGDGVQLIDIRGIG